MRLVRYFANSAVLAQLAESVEIGRRVAASAYRFNVAVSADRRVFAALERAMERRRNPRRRNRYCAASAIAVSAAAPVSNWSRARRA